MSVNYNPTTAKELVEYIQHYYNDDDIITGVIWGASDVRIRNMDDDYNNEEEEGFKGTPLTDEQCKEVLRRLNHYHDAEVGINWETIDWHLEQIKNND